MCLPVLINLNLKLQRSDPIIHLLYDTLFNCTKALLSWSALPEVVQKYRNSELSKNDIHAEKLFVGILARSKIQKLLNDEDVNETVYTSFFYGWLHFHKRALIYATNNFPLQHLLNHARFLHFFNQKCTFDAVMPLVVHRPSPYVFFSKNEIFEIEQEFLLLQSFICFLMTILSTKQLLAPVGMDGKSASHRMDTLWYYLYQIKVPGKEKSKFDQLLSQPK